ncbi:MAG: ABC transporter permease [Ilumatobacteraceae bacterium]
MNTTVNTTACRTALTDPPPSVHTASRSTLRQDLRLAIRQIRFEQRAFWRNRPRAFFSIGLPLMFLVVFNAINGGHHIDELGGVAYSTWFVPGILAYGLMMATFSNLAVTAYGVHIRLATLPGLIATLALGTVCFTVLGLAITAAIRNAEAAPAITNLVLLPLTFISGIWMVLADAPTWLDTTAKIFPVRAFAHGLQHTFHPASRDPGIVGIDLIVLGIWTFAGLRICQRWFRWESRH